MSDFGRRLQLNCCAMQRAVIFGGRDPISSRSIRQIEDDAVSDTMFLEKVGFARVVEAELRRARETAFFRV